MALSKAILSAVQGVSPIVCRSEQFVGRGKGLAVLSQAHQERLLFFPPTPCTDGTGGVRYPYFIDIRVKNL